MTSFRNIPLLVYVIVVCSVSTGFGAEPNLPEVSLRFRRSSSVSAIEFEKTPPIKPSFTAEFKVEWAFAEPNDPNGADLLKTSAGKSFSSGQIDLLKTDRSFWMNRSIFTRLRMSDSQIERHLGSLEPGLERYAWGRANYTVRAVSNQDVERMVCALLEFLAGKGAEQARHNYERLEAIQPQLEPIIAEAREKREAKGSEVSVTYQKYMDAIRNSPYSKYNSDDVPDEVRKTIFEMDKMLDVLNIEIVGIQAKLAAINKHSQAKDVQQSQTLALTLREMAIRQEIELVGAESRRQAIMSVKRREEALYNQYEEYRDLKAEVDDLTQNISRASSLSSEMSRELGRIEPGKRFVKLNGRDVFVRQVVVR